MRDEGKGKRISCRVMKSRRGCNEIPMSFLSENLQSAACSNASLSALYVAIAETGVTRDGSNPMYGNEEESILFGNLWPANCEME